MEFVHPRIDSTISEFDMLYEMMENSSSAVGFLISLGKKFIMNSTKELGEIILPRLKVLDNTIAPRVNIGYVILIWFVLEVILLIIFISSLPKMFVDNV